MLTKHFKKGFSLVELLVVITIMAILSVTAYIAVGGQTTKAQNSKRLQDISTLQQALELYLVKENQYPESLSDMGANIISEIPKDPSTKSVYYYKRGDSAGGDGENAKTYVLATIQDVVEATDQLTSHVATNDPDFQLDDWKKTDGTGACSVSQDDADSNSNCVPYLPQ